MNDKQKKILSLLESHRGKDKAITQGKLAAQVDVSQRHLRSQIENLILEHRVIICASYERKHGGYFLPANQKEIDEYCAHLHSHGLAILKRLSVVKKKSLQEVLGEFQTELSL